MNINEVRKIAKGKGVNTYRMNKGDILDDVIHRTR
jgi:hypothetical protein